MEDLLKQIEYNNGVFPEGIIKEIINRKDEAIPYLLEVIRKVRDNPQEYKEEHDFFGHIYAAYLLAQFRVKELYSLFLDLLSLPDEMPHDLFGDVICESSGNILACVCFDDIQPIKDMIVNENVDEYVRGQGIKALAILALHGKLKREDVLEYYRELLNGGITDDAPHVMGSVVYYCCDLYPEEVYDDIKKAYENDLVDEQFIGIESVNDILMSDKDKVLEFSKSKSHNQFINDTIKELKYWACFHKDREERMRKLDLQKKASLEKQPLNAQTVVKEFKVGRNDPCPCGNGKKYKKCCG